MLPKLGRIHGNLCRGRMGRGSNEMGKGNNELGKGNNEFGKSNKGHSHTKSESVTDRPTDQSTDRHGDL